jgi:hypothetical protein
VSAAITDQDIENFTKGWCYLLAGVIEQDCGYPRVAFWDGFRPAGHMFNILPDGRFIDITGIHTRAEMMATHWARPNGKHGARRGITRNVGTPGSWRSSGVERVGRARAREIVPVLLAAYETSRNTTTEKEN